MGETVGIYLLLFLLFYTSYFIIYKESTILLVFIYIMSWIGFVIYYSLFLFIDYFGYVYVFYFYLFIYVFCLSRILFIFGLDVG
jgi:hypothetical protein